MEHDLRLNNDVENGLHVRVHRYGRKGVQVTIAARKVGGTPRSISWFGWQPSIESAWVYGRDLYALLVEKELG